VSLASGITAEQISIFLGISVLRFARGSGISHFRAKAFRKSMFGQKSLGKILGEKLKPLRFK
jgi:hypothetical protein